jgi:hypothetical protein
LRTNRQVRAYRKAFSGAAAARHHTPLAIFS